LLSIEMQYQSLSIVLVLFVVTLVHTIEPHHWIPFALVGRGQGWSMAKTLTVTAVSGLSKSVVSVAMGFGVAFLGLQITRYVEGGESLTGSLLVLLGLGFIIFSRGHSHNNASTNPALSDKAAALSLFTMATLSPCVELLPIFLAASTFTWPVLLLMAIAFTLANLLGMVFLTALAYKGTKALELKWLEAYERHIIGLMLILLGLALLFYHHS
jgi:cadmium resistance protein CadD (predicted permease)